MRLSACGLVGSFYWSDDRALQHGGEQDLPPAPVGVGSLGSIVFAEVNLPDLLEDGPGKHWPALWHQATHPAVPAGQPAPTWWFYAVTLIGACIVPYQVIFFSSGGREEGWTSKSITEMRANPFVGFPLGGLLSLAIMAAAVPVLEPAGISVSHLGQVALPVAVALGRAGLAVVFVSFFAATFAAAAESALSSGYSVAQYMGWSWASGTRPARQPGSTWSAWPA